MTTDERRHLGRRIRAAREAKGLRQAALARLLNLKSRVSLCEYESGRKEPSLSTVILIASALDVTTDYLLKKPQRLKPAREALAG